MARAQGNADLIDVGGSAYAATDGDPRTTGPPTGRRATSGGADPNGATAPARGGRGPVDAQRLAVAHHPTLVAVDLGTVPQVRTLDEGRSADRRTAPG